MICIYTFLRIAFRVGLYLSSENYKWENKFFEVACLIMLVVSAIAGITFLSLTVTTIRVKKSGRNAVDELRRDERLEKAE